MLPKTSYPLYDLVIPSTGKTIQVRPFLVKEEKLLLIALESNDNDEIIKTTMQVLNNCITDKTDLSKLPFFDIDYLFIALRAKSVGESVDIKFTCKMNGCETEFPVNLDILNVKLEKNESIKQKIDLSDGLSIKMKYPTYSEMKKLTFTDTTLLTAIDTVCACVDIITEKDKVHTRKDFTPKELKDFIEGLTKPNFLKLEEFVNNFPSFLVTSKATCPKCNYKHDIEYNDFLSFFE